MAKAPNTKDKAWPLFDAIVHGSPLRDASPWQHDGRFTPDFETLARLLAVPIHLAADVRSGVPALALDVWVAYELRRAGFDPDWIWPRAEPPRVVSRDVLRFIESVPAKNRVELMRRLKTGPNNGTGMASANLLGNHYVKQVDVVMSAWETGPEILISTKRMDSSFGNNAFNRIEESYGDAKNLRLRHPSAAVGFLYALRSTAWAKAAAKGEAGIAERIVDLIAKLQSEPDAYHACCVIVPEYAGSAPKESSGTEISENAFDELVSDSPDDQIIDQTDAVDSTVNIDDELADLPVVAIRLDLIDELVSPERFFKTIVDAVLGNTPVSHHREARRRRAG